mgnify:CR=1 FL=1
MQTFAARVIHFYETLFFNGHLPEGISVMNPFRDNPEILPLISAFYNKYYNDTNTRTIVLGINPGRFGAGVTGIPFTDTKRLEEKCGLHFRGSETYETSSVFIYEMIDAYGGPEKFYGDFYVGAVSPLGFTARSKNGKEINYNYYDSNQLIESVYGFITESIQRQLDFGIYRDICFCLGTGRNYRFLSELNRKFRFFDKIEPLDHPRFIMQYRMKQKKFYINTYIEKLKSRGQDSRNKRDPD